MILNILLMLLFLGLPAIWTIMMGWLGYRMGTDGGLLSGATNMASGAASSTKSGTSKISAKRK
jgi:hypothetical protein